MSDYFSGIRNIGPSYPVKPVTPAHKDRETGNRRERKQQPEPESDPDSDDDEHKPTIDEHA